VTTDQRVVAEQEIQEVAIKRRYMGGEEMEGWGDRDPTPKNIGELILAAKSRYRWQQNFKLLARRTQTPPQDEEQ